MGVVTRAGPALTGDVICGEVTSQETGRTDKRVRLWLFGTTLSLRFISKMKFERNKFSESGMIAYQPHPDS